MTDLELLATTAPFTVLDAAALGSILPHLTPVQLLAGETLFLQGDAADALFVLTEGQLDVLVGTAGHEKRVSTVTPGTCVGEIAFFDLLWRGGEARAGTRSATVRAQGAARMLKLPEQVAGELLQSEPAFRAAFTQLMALRLADMRSLLAPLFGELPDDLLHDLQGCLNRVAVSAGELLFSAGDPADAIYIILEGRMQVFRETPDEPLPPIDRGPGEVIGEIALLTGDPRSASVRALRDSSAARLSATGLLKVLHRYPDAHFALTRKLARRLATSARPPASPRTYALVPAHPGVELGAFAQELARHLPGKGLVVDSARVDAAQGSTPRSPGSALHAIGRSSPGWRASSTSMTSSSLSPTPRRAPGPCGACARPTVSCWSGGRRTMPRQVPSSRSSRADSSPPGGGWIASCSCTPPAPSGPPAPRVGSTRGPAFPTTTCGSAMSTTTRGSRGT